MTAARPELFLDRCVSSWHVKGRIACVTSEPSQPNKNILDQEVVSLQNSNTRKLHTSSTYPTDLIAPRHTTRHSNHKPKFLPLHLNLSRYNDVNPPIRQTPFPLSHDATSRINELFLTLVLGVKPHLLSRKHTGKALAHIRVLDVYTTLDKY